MSLNLLQYAIACKASYEEVLPSDGILNARFDQVERIDVGCATAFVAYCHEVDRYLVVYRGTNQLRDICRAWMAMGSEFSPQMMKEEFELFSKVESFFTYRGREWFSDISVTGHSWGGVLAMRHAESFVFDNCIVFGCPRIGQCGHDTIRVVNGHDIVSWMWPWHKHHGEVVQLPGSRWSCLQDHFISSYIRKLRECESQNT